MSENTTAAYLSMINIAEKNISRIESVQNDHTNKLSTMNSDIMQFNKNMDHMHKNIKRINRHLQMFLCILFIIIICAIITLVYFDNRNKLFEMREKNVNEQ
jgi:t-SNARE complex subunit (syntaxin)